MKKILFLFLFLLSINSCKKDEDDIVSPGNEYTPKIITENYGNAKLVGFVKDKSGNPLSDVTVFFGEEKTLTKSDGSYELNSLSAGSNKRIWFQKEGYASTQKLADINEELPNRIDASLFPIDKSEKMTSDGGLIEGKDFSVEIQPGGFVYSDGRPVKEDVIVEATAFLTSEDEFLNAFPGEFRGTRVDGSEKTIESFGFIDVVLKVESGEPVQLAEGVTAIIKIKAPENAPATIPMWYYDEDKAEWIEEGVGSLDKGFYKAEVSHFTPWNWDRPIELRSKIIGRVVDNNGKPIEGASIIKTGEKRRFQITTKSIDDGSFEMFTLESLELKIEAVFDIYGSTMINYTTSSNQGHSNNLGDIIINLEQVNITEPLILNKLLYISIGQKAKIRGKHFGDQKRQGYKLLLNGYEVATKTWQNDLIEFVVPNGIAGEGIIQIDRDGVLSREVGYIDGDWTCEIRNIIYDNNDLQLYQGRYQLKLNQRDLGVIPNCIENLQNLQILEIYANHFTTLPKSIGNLKNLEELDLHSNIFFSLPEGITNLQNLQKLKLGSNKLNSLPENIDNLQNLKELYINSNDLIALPESFGNLQNLEYLHLKSNELINFPANFSNLKNLIELDAEFNKLNSLPHNIGNLQSLQKLEIQNNQLNSLPESFGNLQNLEYLDLRLNKISSLSESFSKLQYLSTLVLSNNEFTTLPESVYNLQNIKTLLFNANNLTTLPESIGNLKNIEYLQLFHNQLSSLPESIGNLMNLNSLSLEYNNLTTLPESIGNLHNLKELWLNDNQLIILPETIGNLQNVETINLDNNQLTSLPESIGNLHNLKQLSLKGNKVRSLPLSIKNLKDNLEKIFLSGNGLSSEERAKIVDWLPHTEIYFW